MAITPILSTSFAFEGVPLDTGYLIATEVRYQADPDDGFVVSAKLFANILQQDGQLLSQTAIRSFSFVHPYDVVETFLTTLSDGTALVGTRSDDTLDQIPYNLVLIKLDRTGASWRFSMATRATLSMRTHVMSMCAPPALI